MRLWSPDEVLTTLQWKNSGFSNVLRINYLEEISTLFGERLNDIRRSHGSIADAISRDYGSLPSNAVLRILAAPETLSRLCRFDRAHEEHGGRVIEFLEYANEAYIAEKILLCPQTRNPSPVWTALGDAYFPADEVRSLEVPITPNYYFGHTYRAPIVDGNVIDFFSPSAHRQTIVSQGDLIETGDIDRQNIVDKLRSARAVVRTVDNDINGFISTYSVQTAVLCCNSECRFDSFSVASQIGRSSIVLRLANLPSDLSLADTVLHEAIHSFMYTTELSSGGFIVNQNLPEAGTIKSPWTGNNLTVSSYLHACFVWFGLFNFWKMVRLQRREDPEVDDHVRRAEGGFTLGSMTDRLPEGTVVRPQVEAWLDEMRRLVLL